MFRGYRLFFATVVGLAFFFPLVIGAYTHISNNTEKKRYQPYSYTPKEPSGFETAPPRPTVAKPFEYRTPCRKPQGEGESDLCAQWKSAIASEDSAFWAKWGFWIAGVGSGLLLWQIILTRRAVSDTSAATEAMREANDIAERMGEAAARCYLSIDSVSVSISREQVVMACTVNNTGQSPAKRVGWKACIGYAPSRARRPRWSDMEEPIYGRNSTTIPAGQAKEMHPIGIDHIPEINDGVDGRPFAIVCEIVLFGIDVFDKPFEETESFIAHERLAGNGEYHPEMLPFNGDT